MADPRVKGTTTGLAAGAALGSVVPGIGTGIGALVGGLGGLIGGGIRNRRQNRGPGKTARLFDEARGNVQSTFDQFAPTIQSPGFQAFQPTATQGVQFGTGGIQALQGAAGQASQFPDFQQTGGFVTGLSNFLGVRGPEQAAAAVADAQRQAVLANQPVAETRAVQGLDPRVAGTIAAAKGRIGADVGQQLANISGQEQASILAGEQQLLAQSLGLIPDVQRQQQVAGQIGSALAGAEANLGRLGLERGQFLDEFGRQGATQEFGFNVLDPMRQRQALERDRLASLLELDLGEPIARINKKSAQRAGNLQLASALGGGALSAGGDIASALIGQG